VLPSGDIDLQYAVSGDPADYDHLQVSLDGVPTQVFSLTGSHTLVGVVAGAHSIELELVDAANQSLPVPAADQVNVTSYDPPTISITAPADGASVPAGNLQVDYTIVGDPVSYDHLAVTLDGTTTQVFSLTGSHSVAIATGGPHTITLQLVDGASQPLAVPALDQITVTTEIGIPAPVASYGFEEGTGSEAGDVSGNGLHGTLEGATGWTPDGRHGGAVSFGGDGDQITVPDADALDLTTGMTLSAWVYATQAPSSWSAVMQKGLDAYFLHAGSSRGTTAAGVTTSSTRVVYGVNPIALNTWTHLALTFDGSRLRLYRDGVEVGTKSASGSLEVTTSALVIGNNGYDEEFIGRLDEVRVYDVPLSASEIQIDMSTAAAP